jgi:hypothetical protein
MYLKGALDSAQFFIAWEKQLSNIKMQHENLAVIRHKLSIIYKHIQAMHNNWDIRQKDMQYLKNYQKKKKILPFFLNGKKNIKTQRHAMRKRNNI